MNDLVVAVTGASGSIYAVRLLEVLVELGCKVHVTISPAATEVLKQELGITVDIDDFKVDHLLPPDSERGGDSRVGMLLSGGSSSYAFSSVLSDSTVSAGNLVYHHYKDFSAGIASGSFPTAGMVICPCSMGTLASIAGGQSTNLIHRAAEVHLKERRKLIVVPRETPLSIIQLENMKRLSIAGAVILPAMPGFYHNPLTIHDLIDFMVGRICDQLGLTQNISERWGRR